MSRDFYPLMMATPSFQESNILDAETINWRLIVYPVLAVLILLVGGLAYYYYQQNQIDQREQQAREALLKAKTPEELIKVADQFPKTDQGTLALLSAASDSFDKQDYAATIKSYQRVIDTPKIDTVLHDSAQLGLAAALEASGKVDDAIGAYLTVAHRGNDTPYAPFAYHAVAAIYDQRNDKANEQKVLTEMTALGTDSSFVREAEAKLKELNPPPPSPPPAAPVMNAPSAAPAANAAPVAPAPAPKQP